MRNRQRRSLFPILLVSIGGLFLLGAALFALFTQTDSTPKITPTTPDFSGTGQVPRVSLEEAKAAYDSRQAVFVDVRTAESYAQAHIPGALSIPLAELPNRIGELNVDDWIILY